VLLAALAKLELGDAAESIQFCSPRTIRRILARLGLAYRSVSAAAVKLPDDARVALLSSVFAQRVAAAVLRFNVPACLR
jgi:hypothetical protein